jgi:hypothetical protein
MNDATYTGIKVTVHRNGYSFDRYTYIRIDTIH